MNGTLHASTPAPALAPTHDELIVVFQIGYQAYGLPLGVTLEIVRLPALVELAGAPPTLCGLLNLRGRHVSVLDGRALVGEPSLYDLNSQIVILGREQPELGLLVDRVRDVHAVAADRIMSLDRRDVATFLNAIFDLAEESVLLFDISALLTLARGKARLKPKAGAKGVTRKT